MTRTKLAFAALIAALCSVPPAALGQFGGSRAGIEEARTSGDLPTLSRETVESYIAIDGRAEVRVVPTEMRVVLAVTGEGATPAECRRQVDETIDNLRKGWKQLETPPKQVEIDFIAVLPVYEWKLENRDQVDVALEKRAGYRMQTNVHLAVDNDEAAHAALNVAFEQGVSDIIAFDYWSKELDAAKIDARKRALQVAKEKAELLLSDFLTARPAPINLQEQTQVHFPDSLYHSFTNSTGEAVTQPPRRDLALIGAHRPRNTYYRGHTGDSDVQSDELPMKPQISVVATVRLYFQSPAAVARTSVQAKP